MSTLVKVTESDAVRFLRRPESYPEQTDSAETSETHISWIFLTDRHAYKLKKPVKFEFVDFSTLPLRRRACEDELRLNRRLAPDVYVDVLPIVRNARGELSFAGEGEVVDWVVKMKRLPADRALDVILSSGRLESADANSIGQHLARVFGALPTAAVTADDFRHAFDRHIRANRYQLLGASPGARAQVERIIGTQLQFLNIEAALFDERVAVGRIIEGHGDLRPEHIYLTHPLAIIDCIEFSRELRTVDIADELGFLAMECRRLGDGNLGEAVLDAYQRSSHDVIPPSLEAFYRSYRACVRAKVNGIRAEQLSETESRRQRRLVRQYLNWADHYAAAIGKPTMIIVGGQMGTGKSTLAHRLADLLGAEVISTDQVRRSSLGASPSPAGYAEGHYQPAMRERVYNDLIEQTEKCLCRGRSVILDGTFLTHGRRNLAYQLGKRHNAATVFALCHCPREVAISRIGKRKEIGGGESEGRTDLYELQSQEFQRPNREEPTIEIDSTQDLSNQTRLICDCLHRQMAVGTTTT